MRVDAPDDDAERARARSASRSGAPMLVRMLETLGQAVVDMRGTDAADPRLVLEIALVRLARREAGPPLQALAERVERLERGASPAAAHRAAPRPLRRARPRPRRPRPRPRRRSRGARPPELRRDAADRRGAARAAGAGGAEPRRRADAARRAGGAGRPPPVGDVDLDDVIVAWADDPAGAAAGDACGGAGGAADRRSTATSSRSASRRGALRRTRSRASRRRPTPSAPRSPSGSVAR